MPELRKSLYWKLCLVFLTLFYASVLVILASVYYSWGKFGNRTEQLLHWNLASQMAKTLAPYTRSTIDHYGLLDAAIELEESHPNAQLMLLSNRGKVLDLTPRTYYVRRPNVPIEPIQEFLNGEARAPFYIDDPRHASQKSIFSVAPLEIGREQGYVFVLLNSRVSNLLMEVGAVDSAPQTSFVVTILAILATSLVGLLTFKRITSRFYSLSDTVQKFEKGDFSPRVDLKGDDEITHLGSIINGMADTIVSNIEELEKKDRLRRELAANIAHDLRTPIASLSGYAETVLCSRENMSDEEVEKFLSGILINAQSLNSLIAQLFELSKLEAKEVLPKMRNVALREIGLRALDEHKHLCEQNGVTLVCEIDEDIRLQADPEMINRVVTNLLANALRHTDKDGLIRIRGKSDNHKALLSIEDTGEGIAPDDLPHLFEHFYRGDKARTRERGGAGLGLAISKRIIDLHGGTIKVESELKKGTTFTLEFPS